MVCVVCCHRESIKELASFPQTLHRFLKDNQDVAEAIEAAIRRMNGIGVTTANLTDHAEEDADADADPQ